jgi:predicted nucleic acid-binding protein
LDYSPLDSRAVAIRTGMKVVEVGEASEIDMYVRLAIPLDDGEAHGIAVAKSMSLYFGTDDRKAIRIASLPEVDVKIITTPEIVKHWLDAKLVAAEPRILISRIGRYGRFQPRKNAQLADWWAAQTLV